MSQYTVAFYAAIHGKTDPKTGRARLLEILKQDEVTLYEAGRTAQNYVRTPATRHMAELYLGNKMDKNHHAAHLIGVGIRYPDGTIQLTTDFKAEADEAAYRAGTQAQKQIAPVDAPENVPARDMEVA